MIDYSPFWITLQNSPESTYTLIKNYHISSSTINRLRKNLPLSTVTINDLCRILKCDIQGIARYLPSEEDQSLFFGEKVEENRQKYAKEQRQTKERG